LKENDRHKLRRKHTARGYKRSSHGILRALEVEDLPDILEWRKDPEILRYLDSYAPLSMHEHRRWFEGLQGDRTRSYFGIIAPDDGLAGVIWLKQIDWRVRKAEVGIYLGRMRAKGLGTEALRQLSRYAFDTLNLHKLWATVFAFNAPSQTLFERCGFLREGVLRDETFKEGRYHDVIRYGLLREEVLP